jgi:hypothetical protein
LLRGAVPLITLVPACVVSFNDYPVGDLRHDLAGGQATGSGGTREETGGMPGAGSLSASAGVGGGGSTSGSDVGGGAAGGSASGGSGGAAGTAPLEMAGETGSSSQAGAASAEPVTIEITDIVDAYVAQSSPTSNYGNEKTLIMDRNSGTMGPGGPGWEPKIHEVLLRASLAELPAGAIVSAATLSLRCTRVGDPITVSFFEQAWQEGLVSWYSASTAPPGAELGSAAGATGVLAVDLKEAVTAWSAGEHANFGILMSSTGMNATECASSEADDTKLRPRLSITYTASD